MLAKSQEDVNVIIKDLNEENILDLINITLNDLWVAIWYL